MQTNNFFCIHNGVEQIYALLTFSPISTLNADILQQREVKHNI